MRLYVIKLCDGSWFKGFSPLHGIVSTRNLWEATLYPISDKSEMYEVAHLVEGTAYLVLLGEPTRIAEV